MNIENRTFNAWCLCVPVPWELCFASASEGSLIRQVLLDTVASTYIHA